MGDLGPPRRPRCLERVKQARHCARPGLFGRCAELEVVVDHPPGFLDFPVPESLVQKFVPGPVQGLRSKLDEAVVAELREEEDVVKVVVLRLTSLPRLGGLDILERNPFLFGFEEKAVDVMQGTGDEVGLGVIGAVGLSARVENTEVARVEGCFLI